MNSRSQSTDFIEIQKSFISNCQGPSSWLFFALHCSFLNDVILVLDTLANLCIALYCILLHCIVLNCSALLIYWYVNII